jgi:hypothetical protein
MRKDLAMETIYAMQRANGDWFSHELNGRLSLPLFRSVQNALMSRLRNFGMLLFKPVTLDSSLLKQLISEGGGKVGCTPFVRQKVKTLPQPVEKSSCLRLDHY